MGKNVAVFFDGTRNLLSKNGGTNVFALYEMANAAGGTQRCLYISGVGTERIKTAIIDELRVRARLDKDYHRINTGAIGRAFGALAGYGIGGRIKEAYAFIVDNYDESAKDKLFLFGFSRGAFAARSLAGFINEVGLLFRCHLSKVPLAYELYRSGNGRQFLENNYSSMLGQQVRLGEGLRVHMIGVWDTVAALGLPAPFPKISWQSDHHLTRKMPQNVTHGRHALALHELRTIFAPVPWERSNNNQSLAQVWFAGAHADVGGGYKDSTLSTIPLMWMAFEAEELGLSLSHTVLHIEDSSADIHHQIRGIFSLCTPRCRELLVDLSQSSKADLVRSYSVHWSAIRRQERLAILNKPYPYRRAIRKTLAGIDTLTRTVTVRLAKHTEQERFVDRAHLYGDQKIQLVSSLESTDKWTDERVKELEEAIVLTTIAHGWDELRTCMGDTINRMASIAYATNASTGIPVSLQRFNDLLKTLELIAKNYPTELGSIIEKTVLKMHLMNDLTHKTIKVKKTKI